MLSQQGVSQSGIIIGLDHGDGTLLLEVQLLFHGFTWCQLGGCEVLIHEDSWYAGLHAHCPLYGAEALHIWCSIDLGHDIAVLDGDVDLRLMC